MTLNTHQLKVIEKLYIWCAGFYFLAFPFNPVFAFFPYLPIPLLVSSVCLLFSVFYAKKLDIDLLAILGVAFIFALTISSLSSLLSQRLINVNHYFGIAISCFFYLVVPALICKMLPIGRLFNLVYFVFVSVAIFGVVDFFLNNFFNFPLGDRLLYFHPNYPINYGFFGGLFFRNKSIFQEPGFYAWYLNSIGLLLLAYFYSKSRKKFFIGLACYIVCLSTTFSATGFIVATALVVLYFVLSVRTLKVWVIALVLLLAFLYLSYDYITLLIETKFTGQNQSKSERFERWEDAFRLIMQFPVLGAGFGHYSSQNQVGLASFIMKLFAEGGGLVFLSFTLFYVYSLVLILKAHIHKLKKALLLASLFGAFLHWITSTPFYFSFAWTYFVLLEIVLNSEKVTK